MNRTDAINFLIKEYGFKSYLEIGTQTRAQNFDKIVCEYKVCVDSDHKSEADFIMTSDDFFKANDVNFDVVFIDGDHSYRQSKKDVENALKHLTEGGVIVMHDTLPDNLEYTNPEWCGEVYKTALEMAAKYEVRTFNGDHGVTVIYPFNVNNEDVMMYSYDLDRLLVDLNASIHLDDIIGTGVFPIEEPVEEVISSKYDDMSDEEIKALYKEKTGKKRVASTVTREEMIEAL
mgnify:CR=1 FL=1